MIVRTGNRTATDLGPGPAHVNGVYAINTIALVSAVSVSPVERRYLSREELAAINEDEPAPPVAPGKHKKLRPLRDDDRLWDGLRQARGNVTYAAALMGRSRATIRQNLIVRQQRGVVPPDVAWLLAHPKRRPTTPAGTHSHSPATRALIAVRMREHFARKRAA